MKILTELEEAEALRKRFEKLKSEKGTSRAAFARNNKLSGGGTMVYQHINGLRPIGREAALIYAKGFGCSLEDISPRLALEARKSSEMLKDTDATQPPGVLTAQIFPLRCPECGKFSHKSFIELEMNDRLPCGVCGTVFNINDQYGHGELEVFLKEMGRSGYILRQNRKFD